MAEQQYDVSHKMRELFEKKQKLRAAAKEYYQNFLYNPHRPVNDGMPFDPALQRFSAMSAYHSENFRMSGKIWGQFFLFLTPFIGTYLYVTSHQRKKEELLRSGKVAYTDRQFKMIF